MRVLAALLAAALSDPASLATGEQPSPGTLTRPPELIEFVPAEYPPEAEAAGVEGSVVLSIVIGTEGEVRQAQVIEPGPHPGFGPAALHAVQQFRFRPAEIDGVPAAVEISYRYDFVLRKVEPPPPAEAPIVLEGRVVERGTRSPVAAATIESQGVAVETGADGRFALRGIPPGDVLVRIVSPDHEPLTVTERIEQGTRREVEYRVTRRHYDPYEAVVRGERTRREVSVHNLATEEVRTIAGTQGDTLKVLQSLPGVARSPFGIGLLVVRGSEPTETVVYVDGIPIPLLFHFGGVTSVVNADVVEALEFFPGNFGTRYGRALGGSVELRTREPRREWHGAAQLDLFDGRVEVEGPVGKGSAYASLRRSWVDAVLAVALPRIDRDADDDLRVAPRYYDYQAKLTLPALGGQASFFAFGSDDRLEFVRDEDRPGRPTFFLSTDFWRVGASHRRPLGATTTHEVGLAVGRDGFDVIRGGAFGLLTDVFTISLRDTVTWKIGPELTVVSGVDAWLRRIEYSVYAPPVESPGAIGDVDVEETPSTVGERGSGWWLSPAAYLEADWRPAPRLRLVGGLRADVESRFGDAKLWVDPRLSAFYDVAPRTTLLAAAGLFGSAPDPQETSPTFGNPSLDPERGLHLSLGVRQQLPWSSRLELTGFYKYLWSLVVPTRDVGSDGRLLRLSNEGRGETIGAELLVRRELARGLFGWLAWTWSRSLRRDDSTDPAYPSWRLFAFDQTHIVALVLSYRLPRDWILGTRVRAVSGNPYSGTDGAVLDSDTGRVQCIPARTRLSRRLPGFFQADARIDKRFVFESWMLSVYLDVQNTTNRENAEFRFNNYDCTADVPIPSIPFLPAIGLRAEW
jgi:TonB family protein